MFVNYELILWWNRTQVPTPVVFIKPKQSNNAGTIELRGMMEYREVAVKGHGFLTTSLDLVEHAELFLSSRNTSSEFITSTLQEYNLFYKYRESNKF